MPPRIKKLIGIAITLPYLGVYLFAAAALGERAPAFWPVQLIYYMVAGVIWVFPLKNLMNWMAAPAKAPQRDGVNVDH